MTQNTSHAVMAQRHEAKDSFDLFPTPGWATRALCEFIRDSGWAMFSVWEPACGLGHMSRPLSEYFGSVASSDVVDYGFGSVRDFLVPFSGKTSEFDWVITNPPFRLAEEFAHEALQHARHGVAFLVRTAFLEGIGRHKDLFSKHPPAAILQFTERVPMFSGRVDANGSTATAYCWIVWRTTARPSHPEFRWIPQCRKRLERASDYAEQVPA